MADTISASVGVGGRNQRADVETIQRLLGRRGFNPGRVDGRCGPKTARAILNFQAGFMSRPDGRIDTGGQSWRRLVSAPAMPAGGNASASRPAMAMPAAAPVPTGNARSDLLTLIPRPSGDLVNRGLVPVSPAFMKQKLGEPRRSYTAECQPMTNEKLKAQVVTASMGRFKVTGLRPAVESLQMALAQVQRELPEVHSALGTAGMLCCRLIRGSASAVSNHAWGTAIDFTLNGALDRRGDGRVQLGLSLMAPIMNQHGWYWGAAFRTEDAMHFEASQGLILRWASQLG
ncbi:M15 family metallopeptidase [Uliginosibacterium paludis]|uniref:M15 family metallopeptidase n=1 Tax=Uliginosibacterium paludis TaxID=1615952 RepID=A0ABV2CNP7_9RHOO